MKVLITGSHGLIGSALVRHFSGQGDEVVRLVRSPSPAGEVEFQWDPERGWIDPNALEHVDAVIHLAGESLAGGRWTKERKQSIRDSRICSTRLLASALAAANQPPAVFFSASATGVYGDRGDEILGEQSSAGTGFLADLCQEWEAAAESAAGPGLRVLHLRFGIILAKQGGALAKMLPPFRLGLGGPMGSGQQFWSWITLEDAVRAVDFAMNHAQLRGPINLAAPQAVRNREFARTLAKSLGRPALLRVPALALRIAFGEMADAALLASARVQPDILLSSGFSFRHPNLEPALRAVLNSPAPPGGHGQSH